MAKKPRKIYSFKSRVSYADAVAAKQSVTVLRGESVRVTMKANGSLANFVEIIARDDNRISEIVGVFEQLDNK